MFEVLFGGAQTTVQDLGRFGRYRYAICPSGAQDNFSFQIGNILLKNRGDRAALEIAVVGPQLRVHEDTVVVITGADLSPRVNGKGIDLWKTRRVKAGDVISFGQLRSGCRAYLCVAGGVDVPLVFGSRSTGTLNKIGGYKGRKLEKGDIIRTFKPEFPLEEIEGRNLPEEYIPNFWVEAKLRMIPGAYDYRLTEESLNEFLNATWRVAPNSNRVAYYLNGPKLSFRPEEQPFGAGSNPSNVVDIAYPIGSVQVPGGQHPVLLMNDGVTGGGFAIVGTIVRADLDIAAQLKPGDRLVFKSIGITEALQIRKAKADKISAIKGATHYPF
jgi:biotin-dependent carboxylase-like uncharacterized protein